MLFSWCSSKLPTPKNFAREFVFEVGLANVPQSCQHPCVLITKRIVFHVIQLMLMFLKVADTQEFYHRVCFRGWSRQCSPKLPTPLCVNYKANFIPFYSVMLMFLKVADTQECCQRVCVRGWSRQCSPKLPTPLCVKKRMLFHVIQLMFLKVADTQECCQRVCFRGRSSQCSSKLQTPLCVNYQAN